MLSTEEFEIYGKYLVGNETELELEKLMRGRFLKNKMRERLKAEIGDHGDNITDVMRGVLIGYAVNSGIISDPLIIQRLNDYITRMLETYGGPEGIMNIFEYNETAIINHVKYEYFRAKELINNATTIEEIRSIDID